MLNIFINIAEGGTLKFSDLGIVRGFSLFFYSHLTPKKNLGATDHNSSFLYLIMG